LHRDRSSGGLSVTAGANDGDEVGENKANQDAGKAEDDNLDVGDLGLFGKDRVNHNEMHYAGCWFKVKR
jgi:hypothetical protein